MRTLIIDATLVDGTGSAPRENVTVVIEDHLVTEVVERRAPYYDRGAPIIDAGGGFVLPGLINHHVHGLTRGPLMIVGELPLDDLRVRANLDRLMTQGVTTALNVDGFATTEEAVASSRFHPMAVKVSTLHTPTHLRWATEGPFPFGGVKEKHRWTVEKMLERGAPAIGEAGPGVDTHWPDYTLIPEFFASRYEMRVAVEQARGNRSRRRSQPRESSTSRSSCTTRPELSRSWLVLPRTSAGP
jgi:hypothetical protein